MKKILTILLMFMAVTVSAQVQNITGTVTDESGEDLIGAGKREKGAKC